MANALKFTSITQLKNSAEIVPEKMRLMSKNFKAAKLIDDAKKLLTKAGEVKDDPEDAFIYYSRCMHVCTSMMECIDFQSFTQHPENARIYRQIFERALSECERLEKELIAKYDALDLASFKMQSIEMFPVVNSQAKLHPVDRDDFGNFIKPKQLIDYVETLRRIVLIVDYRIKKDPIIRYSDSNFIRVLPIEENLLAHGLIFNHLRLYIDFRYRPTLDEIQNFDLVVLMGDELQIANGTPFKQGAKTRILLDSLTERNFSNQLKRKPLLLEGGFRAFEDAYPMYVEHINNQPFIDNFSHADDFTKLVQMVKHDMPSELEYPEQITERQVQPKPEKPSIPPRPVSSAQIAPSEPNTTQFPVTYDSEPVSYDNKSECRSEVKAPKFEKALPQVPTRGGARMDISTVAPRPVVIPTRIIQPPQIPERPTMERPAVERSSKPLDAASQQQLQNVTRLYEKSKFYISQDAVRGQVNPGYTGLVNLTNTCFMNSALQALFNTPGLRQTFGQQKFIRHINPRNKSASRGMISACFSALLDAIWCGEFRCLRPSNFLNVFAQEVNSQLADRSQHDSQEFLSLLVDALHEETNRVDVKRPFEQNYDGVNIRDHADHYTKNLHLFASSPINDIFGLKSMTQLTCMTCNTSSVTFCENPLTLLELPVDHGSYCLLRECLKHSFGEDALDGAHKWNCPKCKNPQRTLRSSKIWELPPVIVICLKRFAMRNGNFVKNDINVDFDIKNLDMAPYVHKHAPLKLQPCYQLYALTNHVGTLNGGHYTSVIHNSKTGRWLKFDDDHVYEIDPSTIKSKDAYILFYRNAGLSSS